MGISRRQFVSILSLYGVASFTGCSPQPSAVSPLIRYTQQNKKFPVEIRHAFGYTSVNTLPQRIVTIGSGADEICLSLGVMPVGISTTYWGTDSKGYLPWMVEYTEQNQLSLPPVIPLFPEIDVEKIIELEPDLILAPQSDISRALYRQLSSFVNVIPFPEKPWLTPINQQIEIISAALGQYDQGLQLIEDQKQQSALFKEHHPQLAQKTFVFIYTDQNSPHLWCYSRGDQRIDFLESLGLTLLPIVANMPTHAGAAAVNIGIENVDLLNQADIVIASFPSLESQEIMQRHPLFSTLHAMKTGGYLGIHDPSVIMAMLCGSPISRPWLLKRLLPLLLTIEQNLAVSH
ncbi:ABC transporter substrate-binding protein [Pelistega indica]|uniref:ABC transporter substrate-binding protein n=1 Tax=Pelistega indica TaxID=1414851 RepID=V8G4J8_9BURK|nr:MULTISPECIES: ABC transporter substrate-binding protein [Pelistega]ETD71355.1 ABC transporter substrate-binding protein [Pelistega indica]